MGPRTAAPGTARTAVRSRARWGGLGGVVLLIVALAPCRASAGDVTIRSRTYGEGYVVLVPGSEGRLLRRRRLAQILSLGVFDLLPPDPAADPARRGRLGFRATVRIRHDFGDFQRRAAGRAATLVRAEDGRAVDLLGAALEGRRLFGALDLRIGRQIDQYGLDFFAFDGGFVRVRTPVPVAFEALGGLAVRATDLLGYPEMSVDGVPPTEVSTGPRFVAGGGVLVDGPSWIFGRVGYRQVFERSAPAAPGEPPRRRVAEEILSAQVRLRLAKGIVSPYGAVRYDVAGARVSDLSLGTDLAFGGGRHLLRVQYLRTHPVFDLDSVFNVFFTTPFSDVRLGYQVNLGRTALHARWQVRRMLADRTASGAEPPARALGGTGVQAGVSHRRRRFALRADAFARGGPEGRLGGASVEARTFVFHQRLALDTRAYYTYVDGVGSTAGGGHLWAVQIGTDTRLYSGIHLHLLVEEAGSPTMRSSFRVFGALSLDWQIRGGTR